MLLPPEPIHPKGEPKELSKQVAPTTLEVDTFEGKVHVEWEPGASVTPMGQLAFFIQFVTFLQTTSKSAIKTPLFPIVASNCYTFGGS